MERKYTKKFEGRGAAGKKPYVSRAKSSFEGKTPSPAYKGNASKPRTSYGNSKTSYHPSSPTSTGYKPRTSTTPSASSTGSTSFAPREGRKTFGSSVSNGYIKRAYTPRSTSGNFGERKVYTPRVEGASLAYTKKSTSWSKSKFEKKGFGAKKEYTPRDSDSSKPYARTSTSKPSFGKPVYGGGVKRTYAKRAETPTKKEPFKSFKSVVPNKPKTAGASWGSVASWYDEHLSTADTYHEKVILPNLLRLIDPKKGDNIIDLACGQGYFTHALAESGAKVTGIDIAEELIAIAKSASSLIPYHVASAEDLSQFADAMFNKALINLAIQNIEHAEEVLGEASRVLSPHGTLHMVMNHPAFRIPKASSWDYDKKQNVQFRRIDKYLSNSESGIAMHPGFTDSPETTSFHRPLQYYFKALRKAGFAVTKLEEWISHKESDSGPRVGAENKARKEIPLFLYLEAIKL